MGHAFISYSRPDSEFVRRLQDALEQDGREIWVDWEDIPPSDKWMARIRAAVDEAEAVIFVLSPDSISSEVCRYELDHAVRQHKRLIPILYRDPGTAVPPELSELNYVFARETDPFDAAIESLRTALDTDLDWVRGHTRLLVRAEEWDREGREPSYTLRGSDLTGFEDWAAQAPDKEPKPTVLQSEFLVASRRAVTRRQRLTWGAITTGVCVAAVLGTVALFQNQERTRQAEIATARQLLSRAEALREVPDGEKGARQQHRESLRAAAQALAALDRLGTSTFDADVATRKSFLRLGKWTERKTEWRNIAKVALDASGRFVAIGHNGFGVTAWRTTDGAQIARCPMRDASAGQPNALSISDNGRYLAVYRYRASQSAPSSPIQVLTLPSCEEIFSVEVPQEDTHNLHQMALSGDGKTLVVLAREGLDVWDVASGEVRRLYQGNTVRSFAISPDSQQLMIQEEPESGADRTRLFVLRQLTEDDVQATLPHRRPVTMTWRDSGLVARAATGAPELIAIGPDGLVAEPMPVLKGGRSALGPDGKSAVRLVGDGALSVVAVNSGRVIAETVIPKRTAMIAFAEDPETVVVVNTDTGRLDLWHYPPVASYARLTAPSTVTDISFDAEGAHLRAGNGRKAVGWALPQAPDELPRPVELGPEASSAPEWQVAAIDDADVIGLDVASDGRQARLVALAPTRGGVGRRLELWQDGAQIAAMDPEPVLDLFMEGFVRFAGQDRYLIVGTRQGLLVLASDTLAPVTTLYHRDAAAAGIRADGAQAVTAARNNEVRLWDVASGLELTRLTADQLPRALALSPDGRWLATLSGDRDIGLYALRPDDLIAQACRWLDAPCP